MTDPWPETPDPHPSPLTLELALWIAFVIVAGAVMVGGFKS